MRIEITEIRQRIVDSCAVSPGPKCDWMDDDKINVGKILLAPGEYFWHEDKEELVGRCERCDCIIGSAEWWHEDSDHCLICI